MKVAAAMAQVEAVKASENEALKRLEATQKEIEDMKAATQEALKKAEMSEAAKKAVEGELRRWREREQKKAVEAASRILSDSGKSFESSPRNYQIQRQRPQQSETSFESSPHNYQIAKQIPQETKVMETRKLEKAKTSVAKKVLMPSLSTVFHKKKNQVEGSSPFSPSEKSSW
ncbi:UNVERIFIED_CONTAM: WEB family protein [Sesamum radiatum]|uniref:WEB family protein n=1 Tax=Sesamum radiatum TaxID=300843 RepID=A0AAW2K289_SESRA